jgi:hypothetical protein
MEHQKLWIRWRRINCIKEKYVKQIKNGANRSTATLEIIHTDICGSFSVKSVDGYDSFITFTDEYSQYSYIYPIKERSKALDKFKIFKAEVENQHDKRIKIVQSNRGGEYYGRDTPSPLLIKARTCWDTFDLSPETLLILRSKLLQC